MAAMTWPALHRPLKEVPATLDVAGRTYFPESFIPWNEMDDVLLALSEQMGQEPRVSWPGRGLTLRQAFTLYRDPSLANNWLTKWFCCKNAGNMVIVCHTTFATFPSSDGRDGFGSREG
jgi:hypothetical protein